MQIFPQVINCLACSVIIRPYWLAIMVRSPQSGRSNSSFVVIFWVFFDIFRIGKIRRMLKSVEKHDVNKLRKVADTGYISAIMVAKIC